ncbi:hypothetical protein GCM10023063_43650 [Arthrobacter methylotrophus]
MTAGDNCPGSIADARRHVAIVVHEGSVNIQGDHEFVIEIPLVIDASD